MVSLRSLIAAAALIAAPVMAAVTPTQLTDGIKKVTMQSQMLQADAQSITIINAPLIIIGQGPFPKLIAGFTEIVTTASGLVSMTPGTPKITVAAEATMVFDAFREFVRVHQALLNILIGKAGVLQQIPLVGAPVAAVLRSVEGVVDTIALFLIDTVEMRANDFRSEADSLGMSLDLCISKYEGLSLKKRADVFVA